MHHGIVIEKGIVEKLLVVSTIAQAPACLFCSSPTNSAVATLCSMIPASICTKKCAGGLVSSSSVTCDRPFDPYFRTHAFAALAISFSRE